MVKDLQYFINAENEFCKEHPNYGELFFDTSIGEMSEQGIDDRLNYLSDRIISNCNKIIKEPSEKELEFKLSDVQRVLLRLFFGKYSYIFRDDYYYEGITDFIQNLFDTLDDMVNKAPINTDPILYRFCNDYDKCDMKVGDIINIPHNLTCTNYDWHKERYNNVYIISPLKNGKTRARNLFEICKHGDEMQIDFLRNTRFQVEKIEQAQETEYKKIYLKELGSDVKPFSGQCLFLRVILSYARSNINNSILQYSLYQRLTNEM